MSYPLIHLFWVHGGELAAVLACLWAFWRGGPVERWGAGIIAVSWILSEVLTSHAGQGPGLVIIVIDGTVTVAFAALSLWSRRLWTLFATAFMCNDMLTHLLAVTTKMSLFSYVTAVGLWSGWAPVIALAFGVWSYSRKAKRKSDQLAGQQELK